MSNRKTFINRPTVRTVAAGELNPKYPYASRTTNIPETIDVHIGVQPRPSFFKRMREKIFDAEREHEPANDNNETSAGVRAKKNKKRAVLLIGAAVLGYGPQVQNEHTDAKLFGIPLPQPIEIIVDLNNRPDHTARQFPSPDINETFSAQKPRNNIPVIWDYDTKGVPSTAFRRLPFMQPERQESSPGLYALDLNNPKDEAPDNDCFVVEGNYGPGKTKIFVTDSSVAEHIYVYPTRMGDERRMSVCIAGEDSLSPNSRLYIYQDPHNN